MVMHRLVAPDRGAVVRLKWRNVLAGLTFTSGVPQVANQAAWIPGYRTQRARSCAQPGVVPLQHRGRVMGPLRR